MGLGWPVAGPAPRRRGGVRCPFGANGAALTWCPCRAVGSGKVDSVVGSCWLRCMQAGWSRARSPLAERLPASEGCQGPWGAKMGMIDELWRKERRGYGLFIRLVQQMDADGR